MLNINYNDNDTHEKVTIIKNNYFLNNKYLLENNSLNYYSKRDQENLSEFLK